MYKDILLLLVVVLKSYHGAFALDNDKPNIVIILIDDMGFNDVSFHGSNQIITRNMDALAYNGIILNRHYTPNLCTPSRASLLTGKFPTRTGMQQSVIIADEPWGLPLREKLMPEFFREAGYATHLIGKWHLGFWREELTPTYRGFDEHVGYYNGYIDHYDHTLFMLDRNYSRGLDFRRNLAPYPEASGTYATDIFTTEAQRVIKEHDSSRPLFLLMAHLAVHTGNEDNPMQAPEEEIENFAHISDPKRRTYAAMVSKVDESVGKTMRALSEKGILNNTIVLLCSDNGAPTLGIHSNAGSNYPLRGQKESVWEGALRTVGAIWSPLLKSRNYVSNQAIHMVDWLPTLAAGAGVNLPSSLNLDGENMWDILSKQAKPQARKLLHVLDPVTGFSAYTKGNLKYVNGTKDSQYDGWLGDLPSKESDPTAVFYEQEILSSDVQRTIGNKEIRLSNALIKKLRRQATVECPSKGAEFDAVKYQCEPSKQACLFNIDLDACERYNLANLQPEWLQELAAEIEAFILDSTPVEKITIPDARADPALHNGCWEWWEKTNFTSSTANITPLGIWVLIGYIFCILTH